MSLINQTKLRHTLPWVDAYTVFNHAIAEAKNNRIMNDEVRETTKRAEREALRLGTPQALAVAANQRMIQQQMQFDPQGHKEYMRLWKQTATIILAMDWELHEEVFFQEEGKGGPMHFWQGEDRTKRCCTISRVEAALVLRFLRWIESNSRTQFDPRDHVKKMLTQQGITKENFHLHSANLAITNPWLDGA
jgi:hypothetical protein